MRQDLWTAARTELCMKLHDEGLSASAIAARLGPGISRNAVIGKIHRMDRAAGHVPVPRLKTIDTPLKKARPAKPSLPKLAMLPPLPVVVSTDAGERRGLQVADLEPHHCRWPIGDPMSPDFHFCGNERRDDKNPPYCAFHVRVATTRKPDERVPSPWTPQDRRERRAKVLAEVRR